MEATAGAEVRRICVTGDTHDAIVGRDALRDLLAAHLEEVDLILHCGDLVTLDALQDLASFAPVLVARGPDDPAAASDARLLDASRTVTAGGYRIELRRSHTDEPFTEREDVEVVVHGSTHIPSIVTVGRTVYIDPGSPTLSKSPSIGFLQIERSGIEVSLRFIV